MRLARAMCLGGVLLAGCGEGEVSTIHQPGPEAVRTQTIDPAAWLADREAPARRIRLPTQTSRVCEKGCPFAPWRLPALQTDVPLYELDVPAEAMQRFAADPFAPEQPATFRGGGLSYPVKVELRGASSRYFPKKSWNVDFEQLRFEGRRRLKLVAEYQDATLMAEKLAYDLLEALEVPAPRARYVRLRLNGQDEGVFVAIEAVDKDFLVAHAFADEDATIWRCGWKDCEFKTYKLAYQGAWDQRTNETDTTSRAALERVLQVVNHTPDPQLESELERHLDLEALLRAMAVDALMSNNYIEDSESFFVHDKVASRWTYVPWDLNNVDARWWHTVPLGGRAPAYHPLIAFTLLDPVVGARYAQRQGLYPGYQPVFSNLFMRIALHPPLRERYRATVRRALGQVFTPQAIGGRVDAVHALLAPYHALDPYMDQAKLAAAPAWMKAYVSERVPFVEAELNRVAQRRLTLAIEGFDPMAGWVELGNRTGAAISTAGMVLTTNLRDTSRPNVPAVSLAPGARVRWTAGQLGLTFAPQGELGLFDGTSVVGWIDGLYYGQPSAGLHYQRAAGTDGWLLR